MADFKLGRIKFKWKGTWTISTAYVKDDIVKFNANSFVCVTNHTSSGTTDGWFANDYANWQLYVPGVNPVGIYSAGTKYYVNDIVTYSGSTYISLTNANLANTPVSSPTAWTLLIAGAGDMITNNVYYVSTSTGSNSNDGKQISSAFATLRYACANVTGPATIYVKAGTYAEQLPITVPAGVTIIGDGMRDTEIQPLLTKVVTSTYVPTGSSGTTLKVLSNTGIVAGMVVSGTGFASTRTVVSTSSTDTVILNTAPATTPSGTLTFTQTNLSTDASPVTNNLSTMFLLSDATMLQGLLLTGMTGYSPNGASPQDITTATLGGVYCALNPASPVLTKSPYVKDCTAQSANGIGAIIDGSVHASGNKSMVFWAYNIIIDNGVGIWCKDNGKSEAVSCFTYYCHTGYATTGGGKIRSLSGNNSYGTYGVISRGFDTGESTVTGTVYGGMLTFNAAAATGTFNAGEVITQAVSSASGKITSVQSGVLYYKITSGTFNTTNLVTGAGGATMTPTIVGGQTGVIAVLNGLSSVPTSGASIQFAGDASAYVIQSVSSNAITVNGVSLTIITLAQQRVNTTADGAGITIRYNFSQIRLTGHDFLSIGTGGKSTTNYPGLPTQSAAQSNETINVFPGRVYYVSTDQDGNFRVGPYFAVNQATGAATLNASAFNLSGLTSLRLGTIGAQLGAQVDEFSTDGTLSQNSAVKVPTQSAVRTYLGASYQAFSPATDITYDLGAPSKRWRSLYVGPGSITLGTITLTDNSGTLAVTGSSGSTLTGDTVITGNLTVNGTTTTINSAVLSVDDKNIELGSVTSLTGITGTVTGTSTTTTVTGITTTVGMIPGQALTKTSGTGAFGSTPVITSVDSLTQITITSGSANTAGSITFSVGGASDTTADGAGITIKGTSDKTFAFNNANSSFLSSEHLTVASTKAVRFNGTSNYVGFVAPASIASSVTWTLPSTDASTNGFALVSNGSGTLSWAAAGAVITSDTSSTTLYPAMSTSNTGNFTAAKINANFTFNGSTNALSLGGRLTVTTSGADGIVLASDTGTPANSGRLFFTNNTSGQAFAITNAGGSQLNFNYGAIPGSTSGTLGAMWLSSTGNLTIAGTFTESSSITLKENVMPITNALDAIMSLVGVTYDRKNGSGKNEAGLIAEEVDKVLPNLVKHGEDGSAEGIQYTKLTAYLVEAIKSLKAEINELKGTK
jgi:hypothetical protein